MKIRRSIYWSITFIAILLAIDIWYLKNNRGLTIKGASEQSSGGFTVQASSTHSNAPVGTPASVNAAGTPAASQESKAAEMIGVLSTYNDVPISFFGRIEDQFQNPVPDTTVGFTVRVYNGTESTVKRGKVVSDGSGFFSITGYKGESLSVVPQKTGYAVASIIPLFKYSKLEDHPYVSDASNPSVIKMWKLQGAEPLVLLNKTYKIPYTNEPICFDLAAGQIVPAGGDLNITVTRSPGQITQRNHGDWSIRLIPVNGGIIETDQQAAQVTFEAPVGGYQQSYSLKMTRDDPAWYDNIQKECFVTSRGGQIYAKFLLDFGINDDPNGTMWIRFGGVANTNSSRDWEATAPN